MVSGYVYGSQTKIAGIVWFAAVTVQNDMPQLQGEKN